jgi:hypothetical protein
MSAHHTHPHRTLHLAEHRGLAVLMVLALLAIAVIAVVAIVSTTRPVTSAVAPNNALIAEQARLEFRRGEWSAGYTAPVAAPAAALDQHERHASGAAAAEYARLLFRRGEWNPERDSAAAAEQARLEHRRGEWTGK